MRVDVVFDASRSAVRAAHDELWLDAFAGRLVTFPNHDGNCKGLRREIQNALLQSPGRDLAVVLVLLDQHARAEYELAGQRGRPTAAEWIEHLAAGRRRAECGEPAHQVQRLHGRMIVEAAAFGCRRLGRIEESRGDALVSISESRPDSIVASVDVARTR